MRRKLAEEKEGKGTASDINSESERFWVGDCDETLDNAPSVTSYLHKHKMVSVCMCVCVCVCVCVYWCFVSVEMPLHVQGKKGDVRATVTLS